jgi:uncharacterized protein YndB with AHSA1/START domain
MESWPGGRLFERTADGGEEEWGAIMRWDPPEHLEFTWYPGKREDRGETVEVNFQVEADGTRVTLIHRGWGRGAELVCRIRAAKWQTVWQHRFVEFCHGWLQPV